MIYLSNIHKFWILRTFVTATEQTDKPKRNTFRFCWKEITHFTDATIIKYHTKQQTSEMIDKFCLCTIMKALWSTIFGILYMVYFFNSFINNKQYAYSLKCGEGLKKIITQEMKFGVVFFVWKPEISLNAILSSEC